MSDFFSFFSWQQVVLCGSVLLFFVAIIIVLHKCSLRTRKIVVYVGAGVLLALEIVRYCVISVQRGGLSMNTFNFQFCNILAIYIPVCILAFRSRYLLGSASLFGMVAGLAIVLLPYTVLNNSTPITYLSAQSIFSHGLMAFLGYELIASRMFVPNLKRDFLPICGIFLIFCLVIKIMCYVYGQNFFGMIEFMLFGWDLPFALYFTCIYVPVAALACALILWAGERLTKRGRALYQFLRRKN